MLATTTCTLALLLLLPLTAATAAAHANRPQLVWPSKDTYHLGASIPDPIPNIPRSYTSSARIFTELPGRGNLTMFGFVAEDGVIGMSRTSFIEEVGTV